MIHLRKNVNPLIAPDHGSHNHLVGAWVMTKQLSLAERSDWWLHRIWQ